MINNNIMIINTESFTQIETTRVETPRVETTRVGVIRTSQGRVIAQNI